jgi:hypothetical protein
MDAGHGRRTGPSNFHCRLSFARGVRFQIGEVPAQVREIDAEQVEARRRPRGRREHSHDPLLEISPTVYVRELVGHRLGRDRKVPCPFHHHERPSLHVYAAPETRMDLLFVPARRIDLRPRCRALGRRTRGRDFIELRRRPLRRSRSRSLGYCARGLERPLLR